MHKINEKIVTFLDPETIEPQAVQQLINVSELPFIFKHIAVMPDCHLGKGATVGSVIATENAIIPSAVGVDIGCGMIAVLTRFKAEDLPDSLEKMRVGIERRIPLNAGAQNKSVSKTAEPRIKELEALAGDTKYSKYHTHWIEQLGSLGSGNHFIEVSLDELNRVWIVLHSGSRGVGNQIACAHIKVAQKQCETYHIQLPDAELAYLSQNTPEFNAYIKDLHWAQEFARLNRDEMMDRVLTELSYSMYGEDGHQKEIEMERINCHHNFTQIENHFGKNIWVTRKGAIQMQKGQLGVIPGSMGTRSYIVSGLANPMSFNSAPHGAGRRFSRNEARKRFTMEDFDREMVGVECKRSEELIDELPGAYKDIDIVMGNSSDLVEIKHVLKQVLNVKGN